jgi:type I restriction enzyme, S subunit
LIQVPPRPLQDKIAEVLRESRRELDLLGEYLERLKQQKRSLMQKLLTGEWGVSTFSEEPQ